MDMEMDNHEMMNVTKKADRQGLTIVSGYEDDIPLPEYHRQPQIPPPVNDVLNNPEIDDSINAINIDTLDANEEAVEFLQEDENDGLIPSVIQTQQQIFDNAFSSLPVLSQS